VFFGLLTIDGGASLSASGRFCLSGASSIRARSRACEGKLEAAIFPSGERLREMCAGIVEYDRGAGRIGGVEQLDEFDELSAEVAIFDQGVDFAR
jgi:hypothetical protein